VPQRYSLHVLRRSALQQLQFNVMLSGVAHGATTI